MIAIFMFGIGTVQENFWAHYFLNILILFCRRIMMILTKNFKT